jgi:hypothetical protein
MTNDDDDDDDNNNNNNFKPVVFLVLASNLKVSVVHGRQ